MPVRRCRSLTGPLAATALAVSALFTNAALAQPATPDPLLERAQALMQANDAGGAYALLVEREAQRAGEPRFDYLLGIAAIDSGHVTRAIFALERVVAEQPSNSLARAELARAYLAAGESARAQRELHAAREGALPPDAAAAIDRVLGAIEPPDEARQRAGRYTLRGHVDLAAGGDTNLNSATSAGEFALPAFGGLVFQLDPTSRQRGARFMALGGGADLQVPLTTRLSLTGAVSGRRSWNERDRDLNQRQTDASVGLSYARPRDTYSVSLQSSTFWLDATRYRNAAGVSGQWQHADTPQSQISGFAQWSRLAYPGQDVRNANRGVGYARALDDGRVIVYGSVYGAEETGLADGFENYGHHALGARAGAEYRVGIATWFASLQYEGRHYGGPEPFFDTTRRDGQSDASLGVRVSFAPQWQLTPQLTSTRSASNVTLYDYRRTVLQVTLRRDFE
jgi:tetratricopeptide (TPR) repeat protein